jgi:hypothetical protein
LRGRRRKSDARRVGGEMQRERQRETDRVSLGILFFYSCYKLLASPGRVCVYVCVCVCVCVCVPVPYCPGQLQKKKHPQLLEKTDASACRSS